MKAGPDIRLAAWCRDCDWVYRTTVQTDFVQQVKYHRDLHKQADK